MIMTVMRIFLFILVVFALATGVNAAKAPRVLLIAVDAIPYSLIQQLTNPQNGDAALFKDLNGPSAVINTFPSNSYVAWTGLLEPFGIDKALGYEARYFNTSTQQVTGGLSLKKVPAPWKDFFDWKLDGVIRKAIAYGWPQKYSLTELEDGLEAFLHSDQPYFSTYIVSTDGVGHINGPEALGRFLVKLDRKLSEFKRAHPDMPFYTIMVSDHGMAGGKPLVNVWPDVEAKLTAAGFNVTEELKADNDAALIAFGLLTSFVAYTWPGDEHTVATLVTSVPGVDICVTSTSKGWHVHSDRGEALIRKREHGGQVFWAYTELNGDPLSYNDAIKSMRQRVGKNDEIWFSDRLWFETTKNHFYPDAVYRLANAFSLVTNPTSVACSITPGYMFGALKTEYIAIPTIGRLKWTHGALHRDASLGFMMSDLPGWPAPDLVRYNQALQILERLMNKQNPAIPPTILTSAPLAH
jgi:hypothetical protein